ncbi:MAG TPA: imidazole glycerol phosphate synthase subunit HisH [Capsulimonadaceae bacterium]|nr:imidazole glycerol phosphate synthase subunit HisH [Capsulimonadaceae bacterium]
MKIAIIDYGMGNLKSVEMAFHRVGALGAFVTDDPAEIALADKAVLPGDGAFDATMDRLRETCVDRVVYEFVASARPFLGICVGMQALLTSSEEGRAEARGLDLVPGRVKRFGRARERKVPQIGWNELSFPRQSALFNGLAEGSYVYFLHSYYCAPDDEGCVTAVSDYGLSYCAGLQKENVHATQFHPEKSGEIGLAILRNFAAL